VQISNEKRRKDHTKRIEANRQRENRIHEKGREYHIREYNASNTIEEKGYKRRADKTKSKTKRSHKQETQNTERREGNIR